jgi:hypothetical protein
LKQLGQLFVMSGRYNHTVVRSRKEQPPVQTISATDLKEIVDAVLVVPTGVEQSATSITRDASQPLLGLVDNPNINAVAAQAAC